MIGRIVVFWSEFFFPILACVCSGFLAPSSFHSGLDKVDIICRPLMGYGVSHQFIFIPVDHRSASAILR